MNVLDLVILGLIAFFVVKGFFRGFFREISSLVGIVLGFLIGNRYHHQMASVLKPYIPFEKSLPLISFLALFILVFILFNLYGAFLHRVFKTLFIGWLDRGLGIAFALIKGIFVSYLLIVLLIFFMPSTTPLIANSRVAPLVKVSFESMRMLVSPDLYKMWKRRITEESRKISTVVHRGKEAVKSLPQVLPDKKE
jgi:membrane protein required for colicin V production